MKALVIILFEFIPELQKQYICKKNSLEFNLPVFTKILKAIAVILGIVSIILIYYLRENHAKKMIIKNIVSQAGAVYDISKKGNKCIGHQEISTDQDAIPRSYKMIYEMNFNCSKCLMDLKEVYSFYSGLSGKINIEFCLISTEKSLGYIQFYLDQTLGNYRLWIIQQKPKNSDIKLYLVDKENTVIFAGDVIKYPFLKDEYLKKVQSMQTSYFGLK